MLWRRQHWQGAQTCQTLTWWRVQQKLPVTGQQPWLMSQPMMTQPSSETHCFLFHGVISVVAYLSCAKAATCNYMCDWEVWWQSGPSEAAWWWLSQLQQLGSLHCHHVHHHLQYRRSPGVGGKSSISLPLQTSQVIAAIQLWVPSTAERNSSATGQTLCPGLCHDCAAVPCV